MPDLAVRAFEKSVSTRKLLPILNVNTRESKSPDSQPLLDDQLYKAHLSFERTNSWVDGYKALLI